MGTQNLKNRIFYFVLTSKVFVIFMIMFHWNTGGFSTSETISTISLIIPMFSVYMTVMINDYLKQQNAEKWQKIELSRPLRVMTYIVFPLYVIAIVYVINLKPRGILSFADLGAWLAGIESCFGIYIGQIVFSLFRKENN